MTRRYKDDSPLDLLTLMNGGTIPNSTPKTNVSSQSQNTKYQIDGRYDVEIKGGKEYKPHTYNEKDRNNPYKFHYVFFGKNGETFFWSTSNENTAMKSNYIPFKSPSKIRLTIKGISENYSNTYFVKHVTPI